MNVYKPKATCSVSGRPHSLGLPEDSVHRFAAKQRQTHKRCSTVSHITNIGDPVSSQQALPVAIAEVVHEKVDAVVRKSGGT